MFKRLTPMITLTYYIIIGRKLWSWPSPSCSFLTMLTTHAFHPQCSQPASLQGIFPTPEEKLSFQALCTLLSKYRSIIELLEWKRFASLLIISILRISFKDIHAGARESSEDTGCWILTRWLHWNIFQSELTTYRLPHLLLCYKSQTRSLETYIQIYNTCVL